MNASKVIRLGVQRRHLSSNVGVVTRRKKRKTGATANPGGGTPTSFAKAPSVRVAPVAQPSETLELTPEIHRNNFLLASTLLVFCGSVMWYSMSAVGQSGSPGGGEEDPLAGLKHEAEAAQAKKIQESQQMVDTQEMLEQAQSGAFDPDRSIDEMEREEIEKEQRQRQQKPWWKVW